MSVNCYGDSDYTKFRGYFKIDKPLDKETAKIFIALRNGDKCMARDVNKLSEILGISVKDCQRKYGKEGQFYLGRNKSTLLLPRKCFIGQPGGTFMPRLIWVYHPEDNTIRSDGMGKSYFYAQWITVIVHMLANRGYIVNGIVEYDNRPDLKEVCDPDTGKYFEPQRGPYFDENSRLDIDLWGAIEINNNVIYADNPNN